MVRHAIIPDVRKFAVTRRHLEAFEASNAAHDGGVTSETLLGVRCRNPLKIVYLKQVHFPLEQLHPPCAGRILRLYFSVLAGALGPTHCANVGDSSCR